MPKYGKASLIDFSDVVGDLNVQYFDRIQGVMLHAWENFTKFGFKDKDNKTSAGLSDIYAYHRSPLDWFGDHGYYRLAAFINMYLHSPYNGTDIYTMIKHNLGSDVMSETLTGVGKKKTVDLGSTIADDSTVMTALKYFYEKEAFNYLSVREMKIGDIKGYIDDIRNASGYKGKTFGVTAFNLLRFHCSQIYHFWLRPSYIDKDGTKRPNFIEFKYRIFDLYTCQNNCDFKNFFIADLVSLNYIELISGMIDLQSTFSQCELTYDGFKMAIEFFHEWTTRVMEIAKTVTVNRYLLQTFGDAFFSKLSEYVKYNVAYQYNPKLFEGRICAPSSDYNAVSICFTQDADLSLDDSTLESDVQLFEKTFTELLQLFCNFVNKYYHNVTLDRSLGQPSAIAYYTEDQGVKKIYGFTLSDPHSDLNPVYEIYDDGSRASTNYIKESESSMVRIVKTPVLDDMYKGIRSTVLTERCPLYLELVKRNVRSLNAIRKTLTGNQYKLQFSKHAYLLIAPSNPVQEFVYDYHGLGQTGIVQDTQLYTIRVCDVDAIDFHDLPFLVSATEYDTMRLSTKSEDMFHAYTSKILQSMIKPSVRLPYRYVQDVPVTRAVLISALALLAMANPSASDKMLNFLNVKPDFKSLDPRIYGNTIRIPRHLYLPFLYKKEYSTSKQMSQMKSNKLDSSFNRIITTEASSNALYNTNCEVNLDQLYHSTTVNGYMGISKVDLMLAINSESWILKDDSSSDYFIIQYASMFEKLTEDMIGYQFLFGLNEQDFYDPCPSLNVFETIYSLLTGVYTDLKMSSLNQEADKVDWLTSLSILSKIELFYTKYLVHAMNVLVTEHARLIIDYTWGDFYNKMKPAFEFARTKLDVISKGMTSINDKDLEKGFFELERRSYSDISITSDEIATLLNTIGSLQSNANIFWSEHGFNTTPLFFGDAFKLLEDKLYGRPRMPMTGWNPGMDLIIPGNALPAVKDSTIATNIKRMIVNNFKVLMYNMLGKRLYNRAIFYTNGSGSATEKSADK